MSWGKISNKDRALCVMDVESPLFFFRGRVSHPGRRDKMLGDKMQGDKTWGHTTLASQSSLKHHYGWLAHSSAILDNFTFNSAKACTTSEQQQPNHDYLLLAVQRLP
jgi:hypothetical protein